MKTDQPIKPLSFHSHDERVDFLTERGWRLTPTGWRCPGSGDFTLEEAYASEMSVDTTLSEVETE